MSAASSSSALAPRRLLALLGGVVLVALYFELGSAYGYGSTAGVDFSFIAPNETLFFLAHLLLLIPGLMLLGLGVAPSLGPRLWRAAVRSLQLRRVGVAYFAVTTAVYALGRVLVLGNEPVTDDENMILFGARMLAHGRLRIPALVPRGAFTMLYTYERDGFVSSADFVGGLLVRAASLVTHLDALLYAILAGATAVAVAYGAELLGGRRAARVAAVVFLVCPMALTLSLTTHAHVASRAFVALAIVSYLRVVRDDRAGDGALLGLCAGGALLCRPFEAAALLSCVAVHLVVRAVAVPRARRALVATVAGLAPGAALFVWYNRAITGVWYLMPRMGPGARAFTKLVPHTILERLGTHVAFNVLLLILWFLGPLGAAATVAGITRRAETRALFGGIVAALALMLFHDNLGIHIVGPIHYSECVVPLTLLASVGLMRAWDALTSASARHRLLVLAAAYVVAFVGFDEVALANLADQSAVERLPFDALERAGVHHAIVVAESPARLRAANRGVRSIGSWVNEFPPPDPARADDLIFVAPSTDPAVLRARFPDRTLVRLVYRDGAEPVLVEPLP